MIYSNISCGLALVPRLICPEKVASNSFKQIVELVQQHLSPKSQIRAERFRKRKQLEGKSGSSVSCVFNGGFNNAQRDKFVRGFHSERILYKNIF